MIIYPSATRTIIFFDFREYTLPQSYLTADITNALSQIPESAAEKGFMLNAENLFSSIVVFTLPDGYHIDYQQLKQNYRITYQYKILVEYCDISQELVYQYAKNFGVEKATLGENDSFNQKAMVLLPEFLKSSIEVQEEPNSEDIDLFLSLCSGIKLTTKLVEENTTNAQELARISLDYAAKLLKFDLGRLEPDLIKYLVVFSKNLKSSLTLMGMIVFYQKASKRRLSLSEFFKKFKKDGYANLSDSDSEIGSLLLHIVRSESFSSLSYTTAFNIGKIKFAGSTKETVEAIFKILHANKIKANRLNRLPSLFVELMLTATKDNHNEVRKLLVANKKLPLHTKMDANNLMRLDASRVYNLNDQEAIMLAVAAGMDSQEESANMH